MVFRVDADFVLVKTVIETESDMNTFISGQFVRVRVTAVNDAGESLMSETVEVAVPWSLRTTTCPHGCREQGAGRGGLRLFYLDLVWRDFVAAFPGQFWIIADKELPQRAVPTK